MVCRYMYMYKRADPGPSHWLMRATLFEKGFFVNFDCITCIFFNCSQQWVKGSKASKQSPDPKNSTTSGPRLPVFKIPVSATDVHVSPCKYGGESYILTMVSDDAHYPTPCLFRCLVSRCLSD